MTEGRRPTAIEIANQFMDSAPVDLLAMAEKMGILVDMDAPLPPNISGKIVCRERGTSKSYSISVNASHPPNRKRFTLAREISHFILHKDLMQNGITDNEMYRSEQTDQVEMEANRLAAELLMPAKLVRLFWRDGMRAIAPLANKFGASEDAIRIRLKQLGFGA